jgi:hypothetical protein
VGDGAERASGRSGAARRRGAARRGEERRRRGRARRGRRARFGGKRLSALGVYTEPIPFVTVRISNRDKMPFSPGSSYEPRLKVTLLSQLVIRTVTKGAFAQDALKANFCPFVTVGVTTRDKRGSFSLGW